MFSTFLLFHKLLHYCNLESSKTHFPLMDETYISTNFQICHYGEHTKLDMDTIIIGDSFVEGVPFEFEDTLVGYLNKKLKEKKVKNREFLNAGVASYSTYIYQKKIIKILDSNPWLKTDMVILLLDKSDVFDDLSYLDRPEYFPIEKRKYKSKFKDDFFDDLKKIYLWRFIYNFKG